MSLLNSNLFKYDQTISPHLVSSLNLYIFVSQKHIVSNGCYDHFIYSLDSKV